MMFRSTHTTSTSGPRGPRWIRGAAVAACAVTATLAIGAGTAFGASGGLPGSGDRYFSPGTHHDANHCSPFDRDGTINANEVLGVAEQIVWYDYCSQVDAGEFYVPIGGVFWYTNTSFETVPADFEPAAATPIEDFLAKVESIEYTVDPGTAQEKSYRFDADDVVKVDLMQEFDPSLPALPVAQFVAKLPPLPPGEHSYEAVVEMSARHCDGLGYCLEPGRSSLCGSLVPFTVTPRAERIGGPSTRG